MTQGRPSSVGGGGRVGEGLGHSSLTPECGTCLSVLPLQQMVVPEKSQQHLASHEHQRHKRSQHISDFLCKMLLNHPVIDTVPNVSKLHGERLDVFPLMMVLASVLFRLTKQMVTSALPLLQPKAPA